jgi:hypothetical protein
MERRVALIFAVDEYDHPDLQRLSAPVADADALAETLGAPELGGFEVRICHNATSAATAEVLEDFLMMCRPGDLALLHFSCHGLKDESGGLYLAARNTIPTRLASTATDAGLINLLIRRSRASSVVLLLDCCYGGAFERGMTARSAGNVAVREQFSQEPLGGGRGRVVITASSAVQYAFEGTRLSGEQGTPAPSLFTGAAVEGIRSGDADRDADGLVSLGELYDYVYDRVLRQTPHQTPSKWEYGLEGDLVIARSPRRTLRPGDLPLQLVEVIHHAYPVVRRGAVEELARLANGTELPVALAALKSLQSLCDDDSRSVATAAAAAVDALAITVSPPALSFGQVPIGPEPVWLTCELRGPPLVEISEVSAEPGAFGVLLEGRHVRARMDASTPGRYAGTLSVRSPAGEVRVPITGEVREAVPEAPPDAAPEPARDQVTRSTPDIEDVPTGEPGQPATHERATADLPRVRYRMAAVLAAGGGLLLGIAPFFPWASSVFGGYSFWDVTQAPGAVLFVAPLVVFASVGALIAGRWPGMAVGGLFGTAFAGLGLLLVTVVVAASSGETTWYPAVLAQVGGAAFTFTGGVVALRSSPEMTTAVTTRFDWRCAAGLVVIIVGLLVGVIDLSSHTEAEPWMWVLPVEMAILALPIPPLRLSGSQRSLVLTMMVSFVFLWIDDAPWVVAADAYPWLGEADWWRLCLPPVVVTIGCFIGQLPRHGRETGRADGAGTDGVGAGSVGVDTAQAPEG